MAFEPPVCAHNYRQIDSYNNRIELQDNQFAVYCTKCLDVQIVNVPFPALPEQSEGPEPPVLTTDEQDDLKSYEDNVEKIGAEGAEGADAV